jgi:nicotinate-nucleotide adenylyltransferase
MKLGVLGGTFDPVHRGHIRVAGEAKKALGLARVLLVPAGQPMSKVDRPITAAGHRLAMLRLAVKGRPGLVVSTIDLERPGPTYTVDTLAALRQEYGANTEIYFILGWDSLAQLPDWHEPPRLIKLCRLAAVPRPGIPRPDMASLERQIPGLSDNVIFLKGPHVDVSATEIKEALARGKPVGRLVPGPVAEYIHKNGLYSHAGGQP